ncbi:hypothetical protein V2W45_1343985 [Cenococcum geophilum]
MDRFYFGLVRFSNIQILNRFGALIGLIWIGLELWREPVKPDLEQYKEEATAKAATKGKARAEDDTVVNTQEADKQKDEEDEDSDEEDVEDKEAESDTIKYTLIDD